MNVDKGWKIFEEHGTEKQKLGHTQTYLSVKAGSASGYLSRGFDDAEWRTVDLPHDRKTEVKISPEENAVHGGRVSEVIYYRKSFEMPEELENKHFTLVFEGISPYSEIFFNGSLMKVSDSAYCESVIDITPRMHFGAEANVIAVKIDGTKFGGWWYEGAGIYRHTKLYVKNMFHIAHNGLFACPVKDKSEWKVELFADIENSTYSSKQGSVDFSIIDDCGNVVCTAQAEAYVSCTEKVTVKCEARVENPKLWDLDNPTLYTVVCNLKENGDSVDEEMAEFGFRTAVFDADKGFILNGRQVKLKGVCCHQDHAGVGVALPDSIHEYRIQLIKNMGANAYRCAHNWPSKEILNACDRAGVLVMDENRRFEASEYNIAEFENMIRRDRNHPSVIMWSLFNEEELQGCDEGRKIFERLKASVLKLDTSRTITGAMHFGFMEENGAALSMGATGINYNLNMFDRFHEKYPNQPVYGSENNSSLTVRGAVFDDTDNNILKDYDDYATGWGSSMQKAWSVVREREFVAGLFIWTGFDYRGEPTPFKYPTVSSLFGVMDSCGFEKTLTYVCRACFTNEPLMHIFPHWNHNVGDIVKVITVTNCDEVELFLNDKPIGRKKSDVCKQNVWEVAYTPGELRAVGYNDGMAVSEDIVKTFEQAEKIVACPHKSTVNNSGTDAVAINVSVVDKNGVSVADASNLISFEVEGGRVLGCGNGDPNSHEIDACNSRKLFNGKCQAIVMCNENAEKFKVKVISDGLETAEVELDIQPCKAPESVKSSGNRMLLHWTKSLKGYLQKPKGNVKIADTDVNDFVTINIFRQAFQTLENGWNIYRTKVNVSAKGKAFCNLHIDEIFYKEYELWANDKCVASAVNDKPDWANDLPAANLLDVDFEWDGNKTVEITLLIKVCGVSRAGIAGDRNKRIGFSVKQ